MVWTTANYCILWKAAGTAADYLWQLIADERVTHEGDEEASEEEGDVGGRPSVEVSHSPQPHPRWPNAHVRQGHQHENAVADEQSTSLRPAVGQDHSVDDSSPTPVMYIIHTKSPDEDLYEPYHRADQQGYQEDVKAGQCILAFQKILISFQ